MTKATIIINGCTTTRELIKALNVFEYDTPVIAGNNPKDAFITISTDDDGNVHLTIDG